VASQTTLVVVLPERDTENIKRLVAAVRSRAQSDGLSRIKTFRARRGAVVGEPWKAPIEFLAPDDAHQLYKRLHRERVLVVAFTAIWVRRDPSKNPAVRKEAIQLADFVDHKAQFELVRGDSSVDLAFARYAEWASVTSCEGEDDPRCLPLHVFTTDRPWPELREATGRGAFGRKYGSGRARTDARSKRWAKAQPSAYHGRENVEIAGCTLAAGMHWDVSSAREVRLTTSHQVWRLGSRGYLNVYPDGHVRKTGRSNARNVWSARPTG
jgi:hypothetical protein